MREHFPWTVGLGRWGDVPVRLHMFFLLMAASVLYLSWLPGQLADGGAMIWLAALGMLVLLMSVALHAAGHVYAAARLGLPTDTLVIGPLGDFVGEFHLRDPRAQLVVALAGPAANLIVALACVPLVLALGDASVLSLLNPLFPLDLTTGATWLIGLKLALWINFTLAMINLLPARPLDGGHIACALVCWFRPLMTPRRVGSFASRMGLVSGLALIAAALLMRDAGAGQLLPPWFALLVMAILILFSSQRSPQHTPSMHAADDEVFGYDFSEGYTSLERSHSRTDEGEEAEEDSGPLERWLDTRRQTRRQRQQQLEAEEDERVDEILARVHEGGIESLTDEERVLLQRVSRRYRTRDPS